MSAAPTVAVDDATEQRAGVLGSEHPLVDRLAAAFAEMVACIHELGTELVVERRASGEGAVRSINR